MSKLLEAGADDIEIYGGFGGREDHFIGNIHLLYRAFKAGAECAMISEKTKIFWVAASYVWANTSAVPYRCYLSAALCI